MANGLDRVVPYVCVVHAEDPPSRRCKGGRAYLPSLLGLAPLGTVASFQLSKCINDTKNLEGT